MTIRARQRRTTRDVVLTLGAVLGAVCILATAASAVLDVKPLVFRSGSMSPAISTGDLAVAREVDASQLERGDIVSVINAGGSRVTHRLVASTERDGATQLVLKGDANKTADAEVYTATRAQKVLFDVPKAGYVVNAAASPGGVFVLGLYVAWMVALILRHPSGDRHGGPGSSDGRRRGGSRRSGRPTRSRSTVRSALLATTVGTVAIASPAAAAPWSDTVTAAGTTMTTYTVPKPVITSCNVTGGLGQKTATITFSEVSSPYALDYTSTLVETGQSITVVDDGATRHVAFSASLLSTVLNQTYNVRIQAKLPAPNGTWVSVNANQPVTVGLLGLSMNCGTAT
jgi:signal peptidase I